MLRVLLVIVSVTWLCVAARVPILGHREGNRCKLGDARWTCKKIDECPQAAENLQSGRSDVRICSFFGNTPIVCCEPRPEYPRGAIAKAKCEEYAEYVFDKVEDPIEGVIHKIDRCPAVEPLTLRGIDGLARKYPHMALVGYGYRNEIIWECGGSLISERFVISTAQCSRKNGNPANWVRLGEHSIAKTEDSHLGFAQPQDYGIVNIINHPWYREPSLYYDIALYRLDRDVVFNAFIRPICLHTSYTFPQSSAMVTGWGKTKTGGRTSDDIQQANVTLTTSESCADTYRMLDIKSIRNGIDDPTQFCAGGENTGADTCEGDTGGPIQQKLEKPYCMYSLVGVTSFEYECGGKTPSVYTRVSHFVPWIESVVWPYVRL